MNQPFKAVILAHKKAPLEIRERLALDEAGSRRLLGTLREELLLNDVLVLSTSHRTEVYYSAPQDYSTAIIAELGQLHGIAASPRYSASFTHLTWADDAVQHLFEVALGLDAPVEGDEQISSQVKRAYQWSADANAAGPFLHRLLHTIFFAEQRVREQALSPLATAALIADGMDSLRAWSSETDFSVTIQKLQGAFEQLRQEEMRRYAKKLAPEEATLLDELTTALIQKVLRQPVLQLQAACQRNQAGPLAKVLTELFDLEKKRLAPAR